MNLLERRNHSAEEHFTQIKDNNLHLPLHLSLSLTLAQQLCERVRPSGGIKDDPKLINFHNPVDMQPFDTSGVVFSRFTSGLLPASLYFPFLRLQLSIERAHIHPSWPLHCSATRGGGVGGLTSCIIHSPKGSSKLGFSWKNKKSTKTHANQLLFQPPPPFTGKWNNIIPLQSTVVATEWRAMPC